MATLLLESTLIRENQTVLTRQYDEKLSQSMNIRDTLKLAYVDLSRPTHFVIAVNKEHMTQEDITAAENIAGKLLKQSSYIGGVERGERNILNMTFSESFRFGDICRGTRT